ncbi:hypothetical protein L249_5125 [Ophiocordyceps polyrhachis-furcata BCC 54312]|uniref:Prenyltransferase alpha-alpha toroid domain-containing protein n=1 Tax=Ophiocordyceps polyrhachis-furcata BCC 54312 TaxID=1330021 RepID=A0A367L3S3_9HYPO|nr:hypothetical protein L249_5125 [Ophiocordyceps polyrhachis-furcata BCC 54312]
MPAQSMASPLPSVLDRAKHIGYWQRCQRTYLPSDYTSNDSSRLTLAFFIMAALDLLSAPPLTATGRASIRDWVLSLQHPHGGFCGSATHALCGQDAAKGSANLAATLFALLLLASAAESDEEAAAAFVGVERRKLLRWLRRLQRPDGSFGQVLWNGEPMGGSDTRHSYLASCIRWMLLGRGASEEDIDVDALVGHIRRGQTYDGGLAETSSHESHAGYAFCGIAALKMLDRPLFSSSQPGRGAAIDRGVGDRAALIDFLVQRQFRYLAREEELCATSEQENLIQSPLDSSDECSHVGYNGRWNKKADTCYCWWVAGTLDMLGGRALVNETPTRHYLLDITQHRIGGFSKSTGGPPDLFHSFLGLAALALLDEPGLKEMDVGLCCSRTLSRKVELAREGLLKVGGGEGIFNGDGFWDSVGFFRQPTETVGRKHQGKVQKASRRGPGFVCAAKRLRIEISKPKSEFLDPCQEAAQRSYKCLYRNGGDRTMCAQYFKAYRDCKEAWVRRLCLVLILESPSISSRIARAHVPRRTVPFAYLSTFPPPPPPPIFRSGLYKITVMVPNRPCPRLRNGVDLQLQTAFQDGNWPVAIRLAEKRARTSQDGYFEIVRACAESQLPDPSTKFAAVAVVDQLVRDEAVVRDVDALDLLEWATLDLMDEDDYVETLGPLRVRAVKASPKDRTAATRCLESCLLHWDLVSAQQIAAILDRSFPADRAFLFWNVTITHMLSIAAILDRSFPADRAFLFWNVTITHMLSTSTQCPPEKQKLYGMLALKQVERAAQLTEQASSTDQRPPRGIQTEQEIFLLYEIVETHGAAADLDKLLSSPVFGPVSQFRIGRKEPFLRAVAEYRRRSDWAAVFNLCHDCLSDADGNGQPTLLACDWRVWRHLIEAVAHLKGVRHDAPEAVQRLLLALVKSENMRPMYRRNVLLARVSVAFHIVSGDEADLQGDQPSSLRLQELIRYIHDQRASSACFDDIKDMMERLTGPAAQFIACRHVPFLADVETDETTAARLRLLSLKLRYFVSTCPLSATRIPGRRPTSACTICDTTFDGALCPCCLSSIGRDALGLHSALSKSTAGNPAAVDNEILPELALVVAFCNLRLAFNKDRPGYTTPPVSSSSSSSSSSSTKHLLRALFVLERQLRRAPKHASISLVLVQLHLLLGSAHMAREIWDGLAVKRTIADSLAPIFLDRLSTVAPALLSPSDSAGRLLVEMLQSHYEASLKLRMPRRLIDAFEAGNYSSVTQIPQWIEGIRTSCTRAMSLVEESRTERMLGLASKGVLNDARFQTMSDEVTLRSLVDYGSFPSWQCSSCEPLYCLLRIGPPPSNERLHLALLTEAFYDVLEHKGGGKGSAATGVGGTDQVFVSEMIAQLGHSMNKFLRGGRVVGCTAAEMLHYEAVGVLCALGSLCTASPRPSGLAETLRPLTESLRMAMESLLLLVEGGPEAGDGPEKTVSRFKALHRTALLRDTAVAVKLATRWILERNNNVLTKEAASYVEASAAAAAKALGRGREVVRELGGDVTTMTGRDGAARLRRWVLGAEGEGEGEGEEDSFVSMMRDEGVMEDSVVAELVGSWRKGVAGWQLVRWE